MVAPEIKDCLLAAFKSEAVAALVCALLVTVIALMAIEAMPESPEERQAQAQAQTLAQQEGSAAWE